MEYLWLNYNGKRPNNIKEELKRELIDYIQKEYKKKHIPSRRELQREFHLDINALSENIYSLYKKAGLRYKLSPNQNIKEVKASMLLHLILKNLSKFNLNLLFYKGVRETGIDIMTRKGGKKIGIEIKAYNQHEKLKSKDIKQVERFIEKERLDEAIIICSTDKQEKNLNITDKISIINYSSLLNILDKKDAKKLIFIREKSVNIENFQRQIKKQRILDYVYQCYNQNGKKSGYQDILKNLHLDLYSYFKNLFEIYKNLKIPPPLKNMGGKRAKNPDKEAIELWKSEFKKYILEEIQKNNKYPSGEQIGKHFRLSHIWNIVKVSELYKELGLKPYLEREKRITSV